MLCPVQCLSIRSSLPALFCECELNPLIKPGAVPLAELSMLGE